MLSATEIGAMTCPTFAISQLVELNTDSGSHLVYMTQKFIQFWLYLVSRMLNRRGAEEYLFCEDNFKLTNL